MSKSFSLIIACIFSHTLIYSQINSTGSGDWSNTGIWSCGCVPSSSDGQINVNHDIIVSTAISADEIVINPFASITVNSSGSLTVQNGSGIDLDIYNDGIDYGFLTVAGVLVVNDGAVLLGADQGNTSFVNDGVYRHLYSTTEGVIPIANWSSTSTLEINGYTSSVTATASGNWDQTFGNVHFSSPLSSSSQIFDFAGRLTAILGNLRIISTGSGRINLSTNQNPTINISGDLSIEGTSRVVIATTGTNTILNLRDFVFNSSLSAGSNTNSTGNTTINVGRDFLMNAPGGRLSLASGTSSGSGTFNISGNFSLSSGDIQETSTGTGVGNINFVGSGTHTFSKTGGNILNTINFLNTSTSTLDLGTSVVEGSGAFVNSGTLRVGSTHVSGALQATTVLDADCGNIITPVGTRSFANPSVIIYNGSGPQVLGDGHPTTAGVDITIANGSGVSIIAPTTLAGTINLTNGNLNIGASSLTITGNVTGANFITIGSSGSLTLGGSANIGTFPFSAGAQSFANFTLNNTNGVTLGNDVSLSGTLTLTNGVLIYNNRTLTLDGTVSSAAGTISGNASSTLSIGGSGAFGQLPIAPGNTIGTLIFNRSSGTASINSSLIVSSAFNLLNGDFTNTNGLQMANGSALTRNSNAQLLGNPPTNLPAGQFYNVTYTGGSLTTGLELPNSSDDMLGSLTVNTSSPVSLDKSIIVRGNVNLQSSTLQAVTNNITMAASPGTWNKIGGTFSGGTGSVIVSGNITVSASSTPNFTNISTNSGSTLTLPAIQTNITGNIQLNSGSTFDANGGTIRLSGTGNQIITGAGKTFNNITVNKSGGNVQLNPSINLIGILDIQTATEVQSNGNLVLVSTSDAASGNASIASLPSGASVTGNVVVQRFMSGEGRIYRDMSSAVQNATPAQIQASGITITGPFTGSSFPCAGCTTNGYSMYRYDETATGAISNGYVGFPSAVNTEQLTVGRGYNVLVRNEIGPATMQFTGPINVANVTPISFPVTYTVSGGPAADGWNFVGNPFPCTVDWDIIAGWTKTNIQGNQIAIWDAGTNQYRYWNGSVGTHGSGRIASGQGFWVQTNASSPALQINEAAKTTTLGSFHRSGPLDYVEIVMTKGLTEDKAYLQRVEGATEAFDAHDGTKFQNASFSLSTLSTDGFALSVNAVQDFSCGGVIQIKTNYSTTPAEVNGFYSLNISAVGAYEGFKFSLHDNFLNLDMDINNTTYEYEVTNDEGARAADRFVLMASPKQADLDLSVEGPSNICEGSATIIIKSSEAGVDYYLELENQAISAPQIGTGGDLEFIVPAASLNNASNTIVVQAFNQCSTVSLTATLDILKDDIYLPVAVNGSICKSGPVTIAAKGAPENALYRWYEDISSDVAIAEGPEFVTPSLDKSKTYFVTTVNVLGCESSKTAVVAEVANFDDAIIEVAGNTLTTNYTEGIQWFKDGNPINGATGSTLNVRESGTYSVEVKVGKCTTSAAREMVVTGIEDYLKYGTVAYPNPVVQGLNVDYPGTGNLQASVYDGLGKLVSSQELTEYNGKRTGYFDLDARSQGVYYLQLVDKNRIVLLKFLKK